MLTTTTTEPRRTLEELFEAVTWTQLKIQDKPVGLLNVAGFYDPLIAQVDRAVADGLIKPEMRSILVVDADPVALLAKVCSPKNRAGALVLSLTPGPVNQIRAFRIRPDAQYSLDWTNPQAIAPAPVAVSGDAPKVGASDAAAAAASAST